MAAVPPVTGVDLTQFSEIVDNARTDGERGQSTGVVGTVNSGQPDIALKGSLMVWDADDLAWCERGHAQTEAGVRANQRVDDAALRERDRVRAGKLDIQRR